MISFNTVTWCKCIVSVGIILISNNKRSVDVASSYGLSDHCVIYFVYPAYNLWGITTLDFVYR